MKRSRNPIETLAGGKHERYNAAVGSGNPAAVAVSPEPPAGDGCRPRSFFCPPSLPANALASRLTTKPPKARRTAQARFGMVFVLLFGVTSCGRTEGDGGWTREKEREKRTIKARGQVGVEHPVWRMNARKKQG